MHVSSAKMTPERTSRNSSIVLASPFCWPEVRRGGERMHADLAQNYADDGYAVTFLSSAPEAKAGDVELPNGLTGQVIVPRKDRFRFRHYFTPAHEFRLRAVKAIRDLTCDTFYALTYFDAAAWQSAKRGGNKARLVVHSIGIPNARAYSRVPWDARMLAASIRQADRLFVLSTFASDQTYHHYHRRPEVLPPPVKVDDFPAKNKGLRAPSLLFCGDVNEPRKGADLLIRAAARVVVDQPDLQLVFSGAVSATREKALCDLAKFAGVRVTFLGTGNRADLPRLYREASVVVLPSHWEAFGLVLVEALASGTPVVAASQGGGADIVNDDCVGTMFDAHSDRPEAALADAIRSTLEKANDVSSIATCRKRAMDFDWSRLRAAYHEAVS